MVNTRVSLLKWSLELFRNLVLKQNNVDGMVLMMTKRIEKRTKLLSDEVFHMCACVSVRC